VMWDYVGIVRDRERLEIALGRVRAIRRTVETVRRRAAPTPIRILGRHPDDEQPIGLYDGQYGPYVKHDDVSASLPRGSDPAAFTAAEAIELLAARRASGPRKKGRRTKKKASSK